MIIDKTKIKKIVINKPGALGDYIAATVVIRRIRDMFPVSFGPADKLKAGAFVDAVGSNCILCSPTTILEISVIISK